MLSAFALLPAAGQSRRMGTHKLLLPWQGAPIIEHVLRRWAASRVDGIYVVVRADDLPLQQVITSLSIPNVKQVVADPPPLDMRDSIARGLSQLQDQVAPRTDDAWLLAPADLPQLATALIDALLVEFNQRPDTILLPTAAGRRGHPVVLPWSVAQRVASIPPDRGLNWLVDQLGYRELRIDAPQLPTDLDTPADYERLRAAADESPQHRA